MQGLRYTLCEGHMVFFILGISQSVFICLIFLILLILKLEEKFIMFANFFQVV